MVKYLVVFFVSMVPLVELRGAIPFAYGYKAVDPSFNLLFTYLQERFWSGARISQ